MSGTVSRARVRASPAVRHPERSEGGGGICVACVKATKEQQAANGAGAEAPRPPSHVAFVAAFGGSGGSEIAVSLVVNLL
jgi:hypothetical protein